MGRNGLGKYLKSYPSLSKIAKGHFLGYFHNLFICYLRILLMYKIVFGIIIGLIFLAFISCEEKVGVMEQPAVFSIQPSSIPKRISVSSVRTYTLAFKVTHPEGVDGVTSVSARFLGSDQSTELLNLNLYDDGGFNNPDDGDVIARDGIFTNTFQSDSTVFPLGPIYIIATAIDKHQEQFTTDLISSLSLLNASPVIVSASVPDTLFSGSQPTLFSVTVQDSNQIDDIENVTLDLKKQGLSVFSTSLDFVNSIAEDTAQYGVFFDSSFAVERVGDYELEFQAKDLSDDFSNIILSSIYLENERPIISNIELPDTVQRPTVGEDTIVVSTLVKDSQSLKDIETVYFDIYRIGGDTTSIELFDDGDFINHRDLIPKDGIYTRGLTVTPQNVAAKFYLIFQAKDKVDNYAIAVVDSMIIQ